MLLLLMLLMMMLILLTAMRTTVAAPTVLLVLLVLRRRAVGAVVVTSLTHAVVVVIVLGPAAAGVRARVEDVVVASGSVAVAVGRECWASFGIIRAIGLLQIHRRVHGVTLPLLLPLGVMVQPVMRVFNSTLGRRFVAREERQEGTLLVRLGINADGMELRRDVLTAQGRMFEFHDVRREPLGIGQRNLNLLLTLERGQVIILENLRKLLSVMRLLEIDKAIAKVQPMEEIGRNVEEIKRALETVLHEDLMKHSLRVLVRNVANHNGSAEVLWNAAVFLLDENLLRRRGRSSSTIFVVALQVQ